MWTPLWDTLSKGSENTEKAVQDGEDAQVQFNFRLKDTFSASILAQPVQTVRMKYPASKV